MKINNGDLLSREEHLHQPKMRLGRARDRGNRHIWEQPMYLFVQICTIQSLLVDTRECVGMRLCHSRRQIWLQRARYQPCHKRGRHDRQGAKSTVEGGINLPWTGFEHPVRSFTQGVTGNPAPGFHEI